MTTIIDWQYCLKDFTHQVKEHKYVKFNYSIWQQVKNWKEVILIFYSSAPDYCVISSTDHCNDTESFAFNIDDCSLGSYLFNNYHENNTTTITNVKENEKNMNMFKNFDFGPVDGNKVHMSMYGLAVKNASNTWVSYNAESGEIMDVDILNFNGEHFMYKIPVALNQVAKGDVIIHNHKPMFVTGGNDGKFTAIDVVDGEEKIILASKSPFGFNFITKVVSLMDMTNTNKPDANNPFGNMWMFALMGDKNFDMKTLMLMNMMNGSQMDPMMMFALMGDSDNSDMLMAMALMNQNKPVCKCHCEGE